jgi:hypothetical protein
MKFNWLKFLLPRRRRPRFYWLWIGGGIFFLLLFLYVLSGILGSGESAIEKFFFKGAKAIEDKDRDTIEDMVSESYDGAIGKTKSQAMEVAQRFFEHTESVNIKIKNIEILLQEQDAVQVKCLFDYSGYYVGSNIYHRAPLSGRFLRDAPGEAEVDLIKQDDQWRIRHMTLVLNDHRYY